DRLRRPQLRPRTVPYRQPVGGGAAGIAVSDLRKALTVSVFESEHMPREKILVVDDDEAIRFTLTQALSGWGYEPLEAPDVATALEVFDAEQPSAVLQDINLPDRSGLDALLEYKKRQSQAIVIMITGHVQLQDTLNALRGGAHDFISKPIRLGELEVTIRNGIETGRLRQE